MTDDETRFEGFLARYLPAIAATGRAAVKSLRARLPGCDVLIYDNYNALAAGFSPDGKTGSAILSIALYPRWVSLFFLQGAGLPDPERLLKGSGDTVKRVVLNSANDLDLPAIRNLMDAALAQAKVPYDPARTGRLVIKSVSAKQRPRRPA
jgi:hypothetical protein